MPMIDREHEEISRRREKEVGNRVVDVPRVCDETRQAGSKRRDEERSNVSRLRHKAEIQSRMRFRREAEEGRKNAPFLRCFSSPLSRSFSVSSTSSAHLFFFLCSDRAKLASEVRVTQSRSEIPRLAVLCSKKSQRSPLGRSNISSLLGRPDDIYASVESRCTVYFIRGVPPLPRLPCSSLASSCFSQLLSLF